LAYKFAVTITLGVYMRMRSTEVLAYLRGRTRWFGIAAASFAAFGMAGYVGGRITADYRLVGLVLFSTYLVFTGLVLFAVALFINTPRMRRPLVSWAMGGMFILYGTLLVMYPYDRAAAIPMGAIAAFLILSIIAGWSDLCNRQLWNGKLDSHR
jgi:hypothetical protein